MGNEGEQQRIVYEMTTVTYNTITMMMQRSERKFFDLFGQRQQHNDEAGMRINVLHRQRFNNTRVDGRWRALTKADWFRLNKDGLLRLEKDGLGVLKKRV